MRWLKRKEKSRKDLRRKIMYDRYVLSKGINFKRFDLQNRFEGTECELSEVEAAYFRDSAGNIIWEEGSWFKLELNHTANIWYKFQWEV